MIKRASLVICCKYVNLDLMTIFKCTVTVISVTIIPVIVILTPADLQSIRAPTLVISARDDRNGTFASAQYTTSQITGSRFIGFTDGGHVWVGHDGEVMAAILALLRPADANPAQ